MLPVKRAEDHGTLTKGVRGFWPNFEPENDITSASSEMYINKLTCLSPHSEYPSLNVTVQISVCTLDWKQIQLMTSRTYIVFRKTQTFVFREIGILWSLLQIKLPNFRFKDLIFSDDL